MTLGFIQGKSNGGGGKTSATWPLAVAVPAWDIAKVLPRLIRGESPRHGTTHCEFYNSTYLTSDRLDRYGLKRPTHEGIYTPCVHAPSNAYNAGLRAGDRVVSVNGAIPNDAADLERLIFFSEPGAQLEFVIEREGKLYKTKFALEEYVPVPYDD